MNITIPESSLVLLIGPSGSGKSTFAHKHFKPTEIISSDYCRGLVSDDENDQTVTGAAFEVLHFIATKRMAAAKLTVIDATNVQKEARTSLIALAKQYHVLITAIVFNVPEKMCQERNRLRPDRQFGPHVVRQQMMQLRKSLRNPRDEGIHNITYLSTAEEIESVEISYQKLWTNKKHEHGPFDIIGDIHGCFDELTELLQLLGYQIELTPEQGYRVQHPEQRRVIFLGDLGDRGPATPAVFRLVMDMVASEMAFCVPGNHDKKLLRKLKGHAVSPSHGLAATLEQLEAEPEEFKVRIKGFLDGLISHYVLDDGKLVVAHAGLREEMHGRSSRAVREFALYGETTGEVDEFGLPVRYNWAADYRGKATVVYGHTPVLRPEWLNRTLNIDTGCVFGGKLTALRYPEKELVAVSAQQSYYALDKPFAVLPNNDEAQPALTMQQQQDDLLDMKDVSGKRLVETQLHGNITVRAENSIAALEVMSRFAANPKWLIYLPPTMSPAETTRVEGLLEHPSEAFGYYQKQEISQVICEQKHMGSRAIVVVCRSEEAAMTHFGVVGEGIGICYTRTGRRFFDDDQMEAQLLERVRAALDATGFWEKFQTEWACFDCELLPWSVKAQSLVLKQYAAVGAAARVALDATVVALEQASVRHPDSLPLLEKYRQRQQLATRYTQAYREYCWTVSSIDDIKLAPFHLLATQGSVHSDQTHLWHMQTLAEICAADEQLLLATPFLVVDVADPESVSRGVDWWMDLTAHGGEGMVVKPHDFIAKNHKGGLIQPAIKCRGSEYLRIIYGPEYDIPENLERLRVRSLNVKRSLALREFALGMESLQRFVHGEALRRTHECVFAVLALESEPVDPRL